MPVATLSGPPESITAGDTVRFRLGETLYPSDAWTLAYTLRSGTTTLTAAGVPASGGMFTVTLSATDTATLVPGDYSTAARYTETASGDAITRGGRIIRVKPSLTDTTVGPRRTAYNAARAKLDALATGGNASVSFNGQSFTRHNLSDLQKLVDRMYVEALEEDRRLGIGNEGGLRRIITRM